LGWGYSTISGGYLPQKSWSDSIHYFNEMNKFLTENPNFILSKNDIKEFQFPLSWLENFDEGKEIIDCPTCIEGRECVCIHQWFLTNREKNIAFCVGLYYGGFAINEVYISRDNKLLRISQYELCDMKKKERRKLRKKIINTFEVEILPIMKPYFTK
jgi:hypothetical protein